MQHRILFQHKDDPLFTEFIDAHTNEKTSWIKDALNQAAHSDDEDDSGVDETGPESERKEEVQAKKEQEEKKEKEKLANKQISDLEVSQLNSMIRDGYSL